MKNLTFSKRNMFNEDMILTYNMVCKQDATYEEYMEALGNRRKDNKDDVEENIGQPIDIPPYRLKDGREIQFVLKESKVEENNLRWVIEWYEGVWTETEPVEKKKVGFVHRETFNDIMSYTERLNELEMNDEYSPIIVGTYKCKIIDENPDRAIM